MSRASLFRAKALDRLSSPDQLDERMQIVRPRSWLVLAAVSALLLGAIVWSLLARIPQRVSGEGVFLPSVSADASRELTLFVAASDAARIQEGQTVRIQPQANAPGRTSPSGRVKAVARAISSRAELLRTLDNDAIAARLLRQGAIVAVTVVATDAGDFPAGLPCTADIVTGETRPLALLWGR